MKARTFNALKGSIAKWQAIVDETGIEDGPWNCPLCRLFLLKPRAKKSMGKEAFLPSDQQCRGCPVYEKTGKTGCNETPYAVYAEAQDECDDAGAGDAARVELAFLKSLLPKEPTS